MIDDPPLLTMRRNFSRPKAEQILAFRGIETGFIVDAMGGRGALDGRIKPLFPKHAAFSGVAITCHAGPADNLAVFGALEIARPGDVIIATTDEFHQTAIIGDLVLGMMKNKGVAAFVTDGCVRDIIGIEQVALPCFCMGVTPNSPARNGPGTIGQSITIGNMTINSGDVIVGDLDGVVVVPLPELKKGLVRPAFIQSIFESGKIQEID